MLPATFSLLPIESPCLAKKLLDVEGLKAATPGFSRSPLARLSGLNFPGLVDLILNQPQNPVGQASAIVFGKLFGLSLQLRIDSDIDYFLFRHGNIRTITKKTFKYSRFQRFLHKKFAITIQYATLYIHLLHKNLREEKG